MANRASARPWRAACACPATAWLALALLALPAAADEPVPGVTARVQVAPASRQMLRATAAGYGRVQPDPDQVTSVTLSRAGLISRLWARLGQRVKPGDVLLELETAPNARMDYQQARTALDYARSELARLQQMFGEQLATRDQVAAAERTVKDEEARLEAQRKLGTDKPSETVRAPFAGIVTQVSVVQGQRVQGDTTALLLARGDSLMVPLGLEQEEAVDVRAGMAVTLHPVFRSEVQFTTTVSEVHAMVNPKTRLVDVLVRIPKESAGGLVLGETMRGVITLRQSPDLAVPRSAVLRDGQGSYVFVIGGHTAHRVAVTPGLREDGWVAVAGSLAEGDVVVTLGNYELRDGMSVQEVKP